MKEELLTFLFLSAVIYGNISYPHDLKAFQFFEDGIPSESAGRYGNISYPHDPKAFTQGLFFEGGVLYESTGRFGHSSLRRTELETGTILLKHRLSSQFFGEGATGCKDRIIQLTWRSNVGFVYDKDSFDLLRTFKYPGEGWGITYDGDQLIMSDGTSALYFMDPENFRRTGHIRVHDGGGPVARLNELEYVDGEIYANVWKTDEILRIDPRTGRVIGRTDMSGLLTFRERMSSGVLNGIAYDPDRDRLFVTGKLWPKIFEFNRSELCRAESVYSHRNSD